MALLLQRRKKHLQRKRVSLKEIYPLRKRFKSLLPSYAIPALLLNLSFNFVGYIGLQSLKGYFTFHDLSLPLDREIPFIPGFIFIYLGAYLQWIIGFLICGRESKSFCYRYLSAELFAKILTFGCFILIPSTILRPRVIGNGVAEWVTRWVYQMDAPVNLFPSIHVLESWFCTRTAFAQKKIGKWYAWLTTIMTFLVCLSVVLVKQHVLMDILGGIAFFEIGILVTRRRGFEQIYQRMEHWDQWTRRK